MEWRVKSKAFLSLLSYDILRSMMYSLRVNLISKVGKILGQLQAFLYSYILIDSYGGLLVAPTNSGGAQGGRW